MFIWAGFIDWEGCKNYGERVESNITGFMLNLSLLVEL